MKKLGCILLALCGVICDLAFIAVVIATHHSPNMIAMIWLACGSATLKTPLMLIAMSGRD